MPFEVGEFVNNTVDYFKNAPLVRGAARNPFYTAALITLILALIVAFVFRNVDIDSDDSFTTLILRVGFYGLITSSIIMYIHNSALVNEIKAKSKNNTLEDIFGGGPIGHEDDVIMVPGRPINPLGLNMTP
jgi:hypothetical protein